MTNKNIIYNKTLKKYRKKYKNYKYKLLKFSKKEVEDFDKKNPKKSNGYLLEGRKWWFIEDTYYEVPRPIRFVWFRNLNTAVQVGICLLGVGAIATAIALPLALTNHKQEDLPKITAINITDTESKKVDSITTQINEKVCIKILGNDSNNTNISALCECSSSSTNYTVTKNTDYFEIKGIAPGEDEITFTYNQTIKTTIKVNVEAFYNFDWQWTPFDLKGDGNKMFLKEYAKQATKIEFIKSMDTTGGVAVGQSPNDLIFAKFKTNEDGTKVFTIWSAGKIVFDDADCRPDPSAANEGLFSQCGLVTLFNFSNIDTSKITDFSDCFRDCRNIENLDLSIFDTTNAVKMTSFFIGCVKLKKLILPTNFVTSKVNDISAMFNLCKSITSLDLSNFDTSNVTKMYAMFAYCDELTSLDLSNFDTSNVTNFEEMFHGCKKLKTIWSKKDFDTSKMEHASLIFEECIELVGGKGTAYSTTHGNIEYARIDQGPESKSPGYFTESK